MDIPGSPRLRLVSAKMDSPASLLIVAFPLAKDNNILPGCSLSASLSRNSSAYILSACPAHSSGCPSGSWIPCYPLSPPASVSPLLCISSIHLSSCAPARIQQYRITAAHTPAAAMIPFILLHPFLWGPFIDSPYMAAWKKRLQKSLHKRPPCHFIFLLQS